MEVENFTAAEVLKVLVVEPDDSTRNVISALLRKCGYKVTSFSDGLKAWEALKENPQSIDLTLTEVDLPSISGFTLLTLVMDHHVCKRIPVVMMSSKDSVSTVVKCMLKGAADFLIKPIRKNELKNIWQHVWRRQISTAENKSPSIGEACPKIGAASKKTSVSSPSNVYISSEQNEAGCKETKIILKMESDDSMDKMKTSNNLDEECVKIDEVSGFNGTVGAESGMEIIGNGTKNLAELRVLDDGAILKRAKLCTPEGPNVQGEQRNDAIHFPVRGVFSQESQSPAAIDLIGSFGDFKGTSETSKFKVEKSDTVPSGPGRNENDRRCLLNHSSASAFSRYNTGNRFRCSLPSYSMVNSKAGGAVIEYKAICSNGINAESPADEHERKTKSVMEDCIESVAFMPGSSKCDRLNSSSMCAKLNENTTNSKLVDDSGSSSATVQGRGPNRMGTLRSREREAALMKFRQKRKERCFEKKVRYHSRKQLAEQRPRMKGQFVRQLQDSATSARLSKL